MNTEKNDMVVMTLDLGTSLVFSRFHFSEKTTNKIKLMYGYKTPHDIYWHCNFDNMVELIRFIEKRFHVYSTDNECIFVLPYREYINIFHSSYVLEYNRTTETDFEKKLKIFKVAASNFHAQNEIISTYCRNDKHSIV